ncbi:MAG TPA: autotransporter-associated beta strand repeat-containing protein, partial [Opitutaceae bacterium]|nr:autotransporter-associated beta strand repeat-containing protein [Opitutaceae bacterium]
SGNNAITGTLTLGGATTVQSQAGNLTLNGVAGSGKNLTIGGSGNIAINGNINTGTGTLTKTGSGTLTLGAANSFTGATTIDSGTLIATANNVFNSSSTISISTGAVLSLNGTTNSVNSLNNSGTLDFGTSGSLTLLGSCTWAGTLAGSGTLYLNAGSSLTLGANFNDPNLNIVLNGGTLNLNGTRDTFGSLTINSTSIVDFGNGSNSTLTISGVSISGTSTRLNVNNWTNLQDYLYSQSNPGQQGQAPLNQIVFSGYQTSMTRYSGGQITPVPEPSTYAAAFAGLCIVALGGRSYLQRRRQKVVS